MHLLELSDFVSRSVEGSSFTYVASLDIDGAFGWLVGDRAAEYLTPAGSTHVDLRWWSDGRIPTSSLSSG